VGGDVAAQLHHVHQLQQAGGMSKGGQHRVSVNRLGGSAVKTC
jgi:hypothetical protein